MQEIASAVEREMEPDPGAPPPDFERLAKRFASFCLENLAGEKLRRGLALAAALAEYAHWEDGEKP